MTLEAWERAYLKWLAQDHRKTCKDGPGHCLGCNLAIDVLNNGPL